MVEPTAVASYFAERFDEPVAITSLKQTFPGMSRETWIVGAEVGEGSGRLHRDLVLRIDLPSGGIVPLPLKTEWEVYVRLWPSPVPVAEPLWYDEGLPFAEGRPHMVRELVEGATSIPGLMEPGPEGDALRRAVAFEHAEKLALVHSLDWKRYGLDEVLPAPASAADAIRQDFEMWRDIWFECRSAPYPEITDALYWLEEQIPTESPRISLIKGNNGIGEEIWRDARIVAMSDWELAALGDAAQDWAFSQGMLSLWDPGETLAHYEEEAGFKLSPRTMAFSQLFIAFKSTVCLNSALRGFMDGRDRRPGVAVMGISSPRNAAGRLASVVGMDIEEAATALAGPRAAPSAYIQGERS